MSLIPFEVTWPWKISLKEGLPSFHHTFPGASHLSRAARLQPGVSVDGNRPHPPLVALSSLRTLDGLHLQRLLRLGQGERKTTNPDVFTRLLIARFLYQVLRSVGSCPSRRFWRPQHALAPSELLRHPPGAARAKHRRLGTLPNRQFLLPHGSEVGSPTSR